MRDRLRQKKTDYYSKHGGTLAVVLCLTLSHSALCFAQGSVFSIRGLGWFGRPVSARAAGDGGAMEMFDPQMGLNPAAFTRWRSVAAWAVTAPTIRTYEASTGNTTEQTMRFPLIGFAAPLPPRAVIGFTFSDYLDRTWTITTTDSTLLRGAMEKFTDAGRSIGGISDGQVGAGYQLGPNMFVGVGFHYYLGSTRLTAQRLYDNTAYLQILEQSQTDFHGVGFGAGFLWTLPRLDIAASGRLNGRLHSHNTSGSDTTTALPDELAGGVRWQAVPGVFVGTTVQYDGWARASSTLGAAAVKNVLAISVGAEVQSVSMLGIRTPLRLGYRTRTLPFTSQGSTISESAGSAGIGFNLGQDRTTIDLAAEIGSRSAGAAKEKFRTIFVGLTVRP